MEEENEAQQGFLNKALLDVQQLMCQILGENFHGAPSWLGAPVLLMEPHFLAADGRVEELSPLPQLSSILLSNEWILLLPFPPHKRLFQTPNL